MLIALLGMASAGAGVPCAQFPGAAPAPSEFRVGFDSITQSEARRYLTFLATQCEGRGTGQPGYQLAADYVAARFKEIGLRPVGDDGTYFQNATFFRSRTAPGSTEVRLGNKLSLDDRDVQLDTSGSVNLAGSIVLVRANGPAARLQDPELLNGKFVILEARDVSRQFRNDVYLSGGVGYLELVKTLPSPTWDVSQTEPTEGGFTNADGYITFAGARRLLDASAPNGGRYLDAPIAPGSAMEREYLTRIHIRSKWHVEPVKVPNVVGLLEGADPTLRGEYVGVGAHLDHLGKHGDVVFPGADDDGSGDAALLCIAKAFATNPEKPRRSILFMAFFGEEMGLLGSTFLTAHPPLPLESMVAELQMDMVARDSYGIQNRDPSRVDKREENLDTIRLVGSKRISTELDRIVQEENRYVGFRFKYDSEDVYTRSDHFNFARRGIPIAFLFDGFTPDYHQPTDTVDKIDFLKLTNAAKLYYLTAMDVADLDHRLAHDVR